MDIIIYISDIIGTISPWVRGAFAYAMIVVLTAHYHGTTHINEV